MIKIDEIMKYLPHRYPFLLVDRILEVTDEKIVGLKNVTINEPFFVGHFPVEPVMPGVLIVESMGQVGAVVLLSKPELQGRVIYLTSVNKAKFRRPVRPGDQLIITGEVIRLRGKVGKIKTVARVDGEVAAEAELGFAVSDVKE